MCCSADRLPIQNELFRVWSSTRSVLLAAVARPVRSHWEQTDPLSTRSSPAVVWGIALVLVRMVSAVAGDQISAAMMNSHLFGVTAAGGQKQEQKIGWEISAMKSCLRYSDLATLSGQTSGYRLPWHCGQGWDYHYQDDHQSQACWLSPRFHCLLQRHLPERTHLCVKLADFVAAKHHVG